MCFSCNQLWYYYKQLKFTSNKVDKETLIAQKIIIPWFTSKR